MIVTETVNIAPRRHKRDYSWLDDSKNLTQGRILKIPCRHYVRDPVQNRLTRHIDSDVRIRTDGPLLEYAPLLPSSGVQGLTVSTISKLYPITTRIHFEHQRRRKIAKHATATLDIEGIQDDFYLNLLDWSSRNLVALAANGSVLLIDPNDLPQTRTTHSLDHETPVIDNSGIPTLPAVATETFNGAEVTAVKWSPDGKVLAMGCKTGRVEMWDIVVGKPVRSLTGHSHRVGVMDWLRTSGSGCRTQPSSNGREMLEDGGHNGPSNVITTGSRDKVVLCHDIRARDSIICRWESHKQEICGLKWQNSSLYHHSQRNSADKPNMASSCEQRLQMNFMDDDEADENKTVLAEDAESDVADGEPNWGKSAFNRFEKSLQENRVASSRPLLASGGNDNQVCIWEFGRSAPMKILTEHSAAIKALEWSPTSPTILATGGGTNDRTIRLWDVYKGAELAIAETESQVCNLFWSPATRDIISSHGYTLNQLNIWSMYCVPHAAVARFQRRSPDNKWTVGFKKLATLTGHTSRVLYLAGSPDGRRACSAAGDKTLRLWDTFGEPRTTF